MVTVPEEGVVGVVLVAVQVVCVAPPVAVIAVRVFGPVAPYPVVVGVPEHTMPLAHWNFCNASRVRVPN